MSDIISTIDEVTAAMCGWCQEPLREDGPSLLYCGPSCQEAWDQLRGEKLVGYKEPTDLPVHYANQYEEYAPEVASAEAVDDGLLLGMAPVKCSRCDALWQVTYHGALVIEELGCQLCSTGWKARIRQVFGDVRTKCRVSHEDMQADACLLVIEGYWCRMSMEMMHDPIAFDYALKALLDRRTRR